MTEQQRRDLEKMQADAINRMRDMNSKSRANSGGSMPPAPNFLRMNPNHTNEEIRQDIPHPLVKRF